MKSNQIAIIEKSAPREWAATEDLLTVVEALHPPDSVIGFLRKTSDLERGVENLAAIFRRDLRNGVIPQLARFLFVDAYMTVNGYRAKAPYKARATGLPGVWRKEKNLRYLNAVYADLDIGRAGEPMPKGMGVSEASQLLFDLMFGGTIPQISLSAQSGRGLYALWIIREENGQPVEFQNQSQWRETLALYKLVNRAIYKKLECLAADKICDGARVLRVPGTIHSSTGAECFYKLTFDNEGKLVTYTLAELAQRFGVPLLKSSLPRQFYQSESKGTHPARAKGPRSLGDIRARELVLLEQWRGGWTKGWTPDGPGRRWHLRTYAQFLKMSGATYSEVEEAVEAMAGNCQPPYPSEQNDETTAKIVSEVWREPFALHNQASLVKSLKVTVEEAEELELDKLAPLEVVAARKAPKGGARAQQKTARRNAIKSLIEANGTGRGIPSGRELEAALMAQGIEASQATINRDLSALGYQSHPARKRAGRKSAGDLSLPELE
jgi:hypothetical protein